MLEILRRDVRHAARRLAGTPDFTLTVAVTLALGAGAATALFSLVDAVLLRPLPVRAPGELVALYTLPGGGPEPPRRGEVGARLTSYPDFEEYRRARDVFAGLAAHIRLPLSVAVGGESERAWGEAVSAGYFDLLGNAILLGRGHAAAGDPAEVVLGHDYWRRRFGGRREVMGETIGIGGLPFVIVGVTAQGFRGTSLELGLGERAQLWLPVAYQPLVAPIWGDLLGRRERRMFEVTGRLGPGMDLARARSGVRLMSDRLAIEYPATNRGTSAMLLKGGVARLSPDGRNSVVSFLGVLTAGVGFLLAAACVNVAHLQLAQGLVRSGEMAVRAALGAGRGRIASQLLTECGLVSLLGLALSVPVALATQHLLVAFTLPFGTPLDYELRLDGRALAFAAGLTALTTIAFGLLPSLRASRPDLRAAIHGPVVSAGHGRSRLSQVLVGLQVALSLVLLVGAGLFARSLEREARLEPGFRADDVLVMSVDFNADHHRFDETRAQRFYAEALERVHVVPGVRGASWAGDIPLGLRQIIIRFFPEPRAVVGEQEWTVLKCDVVSPGYFKTLGIPLRGRDFTPRDDQAAPEVAVVNEALARRYWPDADPVGRRFKILGRTGLKTVEVIGLARDVRQRSLREVAEPRLYLALFQRYFPEMTLHVRVDGRPRDFAPRIRAQLAAVEPDLPVFGARPLRDQIDAALSQPRMAAALLGASALLTLLLAAVGVYGITARAAAERRREVGIRMALGARPAEVRRLFFQQGMPPLLVGLVLGTAASLALGRGVEALLFDVRATDALTYAVSGFLLAAVAGVATDVPARRAARMDPMWALRDE